MASFSKYKYIVATTLGAICGGSSIYYSLKTVHGFPISKWDPDWDKRDPKSLIKPITSSDPVEQKQYNEKLTYAKSKATRHLILIRHGQYNLDGDTDKKRYLTSLGKRQAMMTGERLQVLNHPYTNLICSTMTRAQETAKLIQKALPNVPFSDNSLLEEGAPVKPEPPHSHWSPDLSVFRDGVRIEAAFRKYVHRAPPEQVKDSYDILVCHGNVIRYFVCRALQLPPNAWLRFSINHASITWIAVHPNGKVSLRTYSDVGHMPIDCITTT